MNLSPSALVWTTSLRVRFIQVSQLTRWPLKVSPFLSSTSMGWPWAALRMPRGSWERGEGQWSVLFQWGALINMLLMDWGRCVLTMVDGCLG